MSAAEFDDLLIQVNVELEEWRSTRSGQIDVLEAGGGAFSVLQLRDVHITTIDIDAAQIAKNDYADRKIVGDLHHYKFDPHQFDLIVCFDVLEHLEQPDVVVRSFLHSIRPGGLIYIAAPYNRSVAGLIAKFTPHWFHVFCYQYIFAPNPTDPEKKRLHEFVFPTYMKPGMNPFRLKRSFEAENMKIRQLRLYSRDKREHLYAASRILGLGYDAATWGGRLLSFGKARPDCTDYLMLVESPREALA